MRLYLWEFFWMIFPLGLHKKNIREHIIRFFSSVSLCERVCYDFSPPLRTLVSSSFSGMVQKKIDKFQWHLLTRLLSLRFYFKIMHAGKMSKERKCLAFYWQFDSNGSNFYSTFLGVQHAFLQPSKYSAKVVWSNM